MNVVRARLPVGLILSPYQVSRRDAIKFSFGRSGEEARVTRDQENEEGGISYRDARQHPAELTLSSGATSTDQQPAGQDGVGASRQPTRRLFPNDLDLYRYVEPPSTRTEYNSRPTKCHDKDGLKTVRG